MNKLRSKQLKSCISTIRRKLSKLKLSPSMILSHQLLKHGLSDDKSIYSGAKQLLSDKKRWNKCVFVSQASPSIVQAYIKWRKARVESGT